MQKQIFSWDNPVIQKILERLPPVRGDGGQEKSMPYDKNGIFDSNQPITLTFQATPAVNGVGYEEDHEEDMINHPPHYNRGGIESINVIEAWGLDFCLGNVIKYICRAGVKSPSRLEDLKKAEWYLKREIEREEKNNDER